MGFHSWVSDKESSFHQDRQPLILSPLDEVMAILRNMLKSSEFVASVLRLVAPIVGENIAKIVLIEGKKTDLGILHFFDFEIPDDLTGS